MDELLLRISGLKEKRRNELRELYQHVQMLAYFTMLPHLKKSDQRKPISEIIPDIYDEKTDKGTLTQQYEKILKRYEGALSAAPKLKRNGKQRDKNNNRG